MNVMENYLPERYLFDRAAVLLLEGAEFFRTHNPPKYKMAIKCLKVCHIFLYFFSYLDFYEFLWNILSCYMANINYLVSLSLVYAIYLI